MASQGRQDADDVREDSEVKITANESRPGRVVFTEEDNTDGWIATDLTVDVER